MSFRTAGVETGWPSASKKRRTRSSSDPAGGDEEGGPAGVKLRGGGSDCLSFGCPARSKIHLKSATTPMRMRKKKFSKCMEMQCLSDA
jgi:hypothetical protein